VAVTAGVWSRTSVPIALKAKSVPAGDAELKAAARHLVEVGGAVGEFVDGRSVQWQWQKEMRSVANAKPRHRAILLY
jgi:hypothetical protein